MPELVTDISPPAYRSTDIVDLAKQEIQQYFTDKAYSYHCLAHSISVSEDATLIGDFENVGAEDLEILQLAGLFHDTGYAKNPAIHERLSAENASLFLKKQSFPEHKIELIRDLILATSMTTAPKSLLEGIMKDADLAHLGKKSFNANSESLRHERETIDGEEINQEDWISENIEFLQDHSWYSKGGKKLFNKKKKENLANQKEELKRIRKANDSAKPEKGVETMYRVALRNHNQLSKIADNKANILLSITAIMLSLILSSLAPKIDSNERLLIPTIIIIAVNIITMFFAILATRPKVSSAPYTRENFLNNKLNILFFGNFYKMPLEEFEWGMKKLMEDRNLLYGSLSKDLYFLGSVLAKKYKYLQKAYVVFMGGLIIASIAFIWAFWVH